MDALQLGGDNQVIMIRNETGQHETISVTAPIVNMNGADAKSLLKQQHNILMTIEALRLVIAEAAPHGRDFQIGDPDGSKYQAARVEFLREIDFLNEMEARHNEIMHRIQRQTRG